MQRADSSLQLQGRRADGQTHKVSCRLHVELRSRECVQEEEEEQQEEEQEEEEDLSLSLRSLSHVVSSYMRHVHFYLKCAIAIETLYSMCWRESVPLPLFHITQTLRLLPLDQLRSHYFFEPLFEKLSGYPSGWVVGGIAFRWYPVNPAVHLVLRR